MSDDEVEMDLMETAVRLAFKACRGLMDPDPGSQVAAREAASRALQLQREAKEAASAATGMVPVGPAQVPLETMIDMWIHRELQSFRDGILATVGDLIARAIEPANSERQDVAPPPVSQPKPERVPRRIVSLTRFQQKDGDYTEMVVADDGTIWWRDVGPRSASSWAFYGKPSLPPREGGEP